MDRVAVGSDTEDPKAAELRALLNRRAIVVAELQQLQAWLSRPPTFATLRDFETARGPKAQRFTALTKETTALRPRIVALSVEVNGRREQSALHQFYLAVCDLEDSGVDIGDRLRGLLAKHEQTEAPR